MKWSFIKAFPKYAAALGIFLVSTLLFLVWWFTTPQEAENDSSASFAGDHEKNFPSKELAKKRELLPQQIPSLALVGADLYDISTGEVIFPNWLGGIPQRIAYHAESNKLIVLGERGFLRYSMNGSKAGELTADSPPVYTQDSRFAVFVRDGDIWKAEVDWNNFRLANEWQVTRYGKFFGPQFAANVVMFTPKALVVREVNRQIWVNLETGDFRATKIPLGGIDKRRSPNTRYVLGDDENGFFRYDVEADARQDFEKAWDRLGDAQWLGNERAVLLADGKKLLLFENETGLVRKLADLPPSFQGVVGPSPSGRYLFCSDGKQLLILDAQTGNLEPLGMNSQNLGWVGNDNILCAVEEANAETRGTWLKPLGKPWLKLAPEPFIAARGANMAAWLKGSGQVAFATRGALYRMNSDGSLLAEVARLIRPVSRIQEVANWEDVLLFKR